MSLFRLQYSELDHGTFESRTAPLRTSATDRPTIPHNHSYNEVQNRMTKSEACSAQYRSIPTKRKHQKDLHKEGESTTSKDGKKVCNISTLIKKKFGDGKYHER